MAVTSVALLVADTAWWLTRSDPRAAAVAGVAGVWLWPPARAETRSGGGAWGGRPRRGGLSGGCASASRARGPPLKNRAGERGGGKPPKQRQHPSPRHWTIGLSPVSPSRL